MHIFLLICKISQNQQTGVCGIGLAAGLVIEGDSRRTGLPVQPRTGGLWCATCSNGFLHAFWRKGPPLERGIEGQGGMTMAGGVRPGLCAGLLAAGPGTTRFPICLPLDSRGKTLREPACRGPSLVFSALGTVLESYWPCEGGRRECAWLCLTGSSHLAKH